MTPQKLVRVRWEDASFTSGVVDAGKETTPLMLETVGFVVSRTKNMLRIGMQWCEEYDDFRHITNIPTQYIKRVRRLK